MELLGKIIQVLPATEGVSQRTGNAWKSQSFVLETQEQYPKKVCFEVFGQERIDDFNIKLDDVVIVEFYIESREWNGRWFTSIKAWSVKRPQDGQNPPAPQAKVVAPPFVPKAERIEPKDGIDDGIGLPF